jgi:hypothetical protein
MTDRMKVLFRTMLKININLTLQTLTGKHGPG